MRKFEVEYQLLKEFPEGHDERNVTLRVDEAEQIFGVLKHPDLKFIIVRVEDEPAKKPRKKKEKKDVVRVIS